MSLDESGHTTKTDVTRNLKLERIRHANLKSVTRRPLQARHSQAHHLEEWGAASAGNYLPDYHLHGKRA